MQGDAMDNGIKEVAEWLAAATRTGGIAVLTGAGVSSESGIPTFRDKLTGLWEGYDPAKLASPQGFLADPALVWRWYDWRRVIVQSASPNPGHEALVRLEALAEQFTLITQNVDRLHHRAGSKNVIELHGNILNYSCFRYRHPAEIVASGLLEPPLCHCGSPLRPDVVWFGEALPADAMSRATRSVLACQVLLVVGTSGLVQPAASLPYIALDAGIKVVEINPVRTPISDQVNAFVQGPSGGVLPHMVSLVEALRD